MVELFSFSLFPKYERQLTESDCFGSQFSRVQLIVPGYTDYGPVVIQNIAVMELGEDVFDTS